MRIAHVVTYVSTDGAFGGPVAVALAQTEELARRGHNVDLLAGWDGRAALPAMEVTHRLFPVRRIGPSFGGLVAPGMWSWLRGHGQEYDVVHVHLARDAITLSAAHIARSLGRRLVLQPHGMIMPDGRLKARMIDAAATRRTLRTAAATLVLTEDERAGLLGVAGSQLSGLRMIPNGIPAPAGPVGVVREAPPLVMFLARLHPRKGVLAFAEAARILIERGWDARFEILGPDEGDLAPLEHYLAEHDLLARVRYRGAVPQGRARDELRRASVYVLPAVREVFPMTVLEALSVGTPVVVGADCGIAPELDRRGAATVTEASPGALADAVADMLKSGRLRERRIEAGLRAVNEWFSISAVGARLESVYGVGVAPAPSAIGGLR